jgi:hypothetical protein
MDRQPPSTTSDEIDLYIRTYYSLLRSSGDVWVRAFEEAHGYSDSSLHAGARNPEPDVAAFAYSAGRLPECFPWIDRVILGQSFEQFEASGLPVRAWSEVRARGRRRAMRWDGGATLAVFITSASDLDDLIPIVTAYQIEWNKLHDRLRAFRGPTALTDAALAGVLGLDPGGCERLRGALGGAYADALERLAAQPADLRVRLLASSFVEYQTSAQRWWSGIEPPYLATAAAQRDTLSPDRRPPRRRPLYFVSSNTHALINLLGGYARSQRDAILALARSTDPEGLAAEIDAAIAANDEHALSNHLYYSLRAYLRHADGDLDQRLAAVQAYDGESGIQTIASPGRIDVSAQLIELGRLRPERFDPRLALPGLDRLIASDAVLLNIDYPLGMAAFHHLSRVAQGVGELRGVYVTGKAATLNGRVGDVMVPKVVYDEHSKNTYLFTNPFAAGDVQPFMRRGTVLDNQKAVTVRSAYLQNRKYMSVFYDEGYTILEMEAGPYLSAVYEAVNPTRHPDNEIVNLTGALGFEVGMLHYASDTPYSRRQSLLSKSMSFFGMESTYACAIAILRRIFERELSRLPG